MILIIEETAREYIMMRKSHDNTIMIRLVDLPGGA